MAVFKEDSGPADGLNNGFAQATGDIYGFVNADATLLPGSLRCVVRQFESRPECDVIAGCGYFIDAEGRVSGRVVPSRFTPWLYVHGAVTVFQQGTFFRRAYSRGRTASTPENRIAWDGELLLDMAMNGARLARVCEDLCCVSSPRLFHHGERGQSQANDEYTAYCERVFRKVSGERQTTTRPSSGLAWHDWRSSQRG